MREAASVRRRGLLNNGEAFGGESGGGDVNSVCAGGGVASSKAVGTLAPEGDALEHAARGQLRDEEGCPIFLIVPLWYDNSDGLTSIDERTGEQ